ncbi:unnamed protein product [Somion occarium]|uniref:glucan 1,3-beta-glucosidase n=1 Tax=Somion occarium TaxID=3059160 RepID=A0ABP1DYH5_9APHY
MSQHDPSSPTASQHQFNPYSNTNSYADSTSTPLPEGQTTPFLSPPDLPFLNNDPQSLASTPRGSAAYADSFGQNASNANLNAGSAIGNDNDTPLMGGKEYVDDSSQGLGIIARDPTKNKPLYKRPVFWLASSAALVAIILAVILPVYFVVIKPNQNLTASGGSSSGDSTGGGANGGGTGGGGGGAAGGGGKTNAVTGGDGSTITKDDGSTFVYRNQFGGFWVSDPENPFLDNAQPNSWTPPLNTSWRWGVDRVNGVNLGGLFVLEPFISPALYQPFNGSAMDEWTLSTLLGDQLQSTLEEHYQTFITEEDIAQIAGAGLNWIRLPVPFWAIETWSNVGTDATTGATVSEPFLEKVCWKYILRVLGWARKYGLRVNLDLHSVPGSQNGYNHSGKGGKPNFLNGVMGVANAQRTLDYIRTFAQFISQPEYEHVVPMFGIVNEALVQVIGQDQITAFYLHAHNMIRDITGIGEGKGPYIAIHDGFIGISKWAGFLPGSDRMVLDTHPYFAFDGQPNDEPIDIPAVGGDGTTLGGQWPRQACSAWGNSVNGSRSNFGVTVAGEFSNAFNDCGLFINGVANGPRSKADCDVFTDPSKWTDNIKAGVKEFALASMDALGDWFFWTWKIGNSTAGIVQSPLWSYQLGLENGWMPTDPREAIGKCASLGVQGNPFAGTFESWQTGGAGAGTIAPSVSSQFGTFPPTTIANVPAASITLLPTYTSTGGIQTLPPPTFSPAPTKSINVGNGWANIADTASFVTPISACAYPNAWSAVDAPVPTACGGSAATAR